MRFTILMLATASLFACQRSAPNAHSTAGRILAEIKEKYVPDGRTAYFAVEAEGQGQQLIIRGETTLAGAKTELLAKLDEAGLAFLDSVQVLPSPGLQGKHFGVVNLSVCNIRSEPKHSAELATQALLGTPLRVWKQDGDFYFVQTPDDYFGWLDDGGLVPMTQTAFENWMGSNRAVITSDHTYAFSEPSLNSEKVTDLLAGNIVQLLENQPVFAKIAMPDGRQGWVQATALLPYSEWLDTRQPSAENIIASAREFIGRPYLWGGTSGKGMDCSGFTKTVFYLNGIQLERDASLQVHTGEPIETDTATWANLQPGDLLFFGRHATDDKKERISHVAIYLGGGKIIHASDRVKVESLRRDDPGFAEGRPKSFIRARRILGSEGKNGVVALQDSPWY